METATQSATQYRSYHPELVLLYQLGMLPEHYKRSIPSSTRYNWKKRDVSRVFGMPIDREYVEMVKDIRQYRQLLSITKALWHINAILLTIIHGLDHKSAVMRSHATTIINTIDRLKQHFKLNRVVQYLGITRDKYYDWRKRCKKSVNNVCYLRHPQQLTEEEVGTIKYYFNRYSPEWPLRSIYHKMQSDRRAFMGISTFYKYIKWLGLRQPKPDYRPKPRPGLRATYPFQYLHMDVSIFRPGDHTKVYLYFLVDNFTRYILNCIASTAYSPAVSLQNLRKAFRKFNLYQYERPVTLVVDNGSENKAEVDAFLKAHDIKKYVAQVDIRPSNSMVEAVIREVKHRCLYMREIDNLQQTVDALSRYVPVHNLLRPHGQLEGLTPKELLFERCTPGKHKEAMQAMGREARRERIKVNQEAPCDVCR